MQVRDAMTFEPVTVPSSSSVLAARRLLTRHRVHHLPVVDAGRLVGVVSDRDLRLTDVRVRRALGELGSDLLSGRFRRVDDVMSSPVHTVTPDAPLGVAAALLRRHRIGVLPVVETGRLVGVLARSDALRVLEGVVESCPGPGAGVQCPGADRPGQDGPCVRLPDPVRLVVVDAATARTRLLESYQAWRPGVAIRVAEAADRAAASGGGW